MQCIVTDNLAMTVYMHVCTDVCHTLLRLAATQVLATSLLLLLVSVAANRKTSPALGLTGGESQHEY